MKFEIMHSELDDLIRRGVRRIGIYGIGVDVIIFLGQLGEKRKYIHALYDDDADKHGLELYGNKVESFPHSFAEASSKVEHVLIGVFKNRDTVVQRMKKFDPDNMNTSYLRSKWILLNTMPKSGSITMYSDIQQHLHAQPIMCGGGGDAGKFMFSELSLAVCTHPFSYFNTDSPALITQEHLAYGKYNINIVKSLFGKMVLHIRDPRQALLSLGHYLPVLCRDRGLSGFFPENFSEWANKDQIDWVIKSFAESYKIWLNGWLDVYKSGLCDILLTNHHQLKNDPERMYDNIREFYGLKTTIAFDASNRENRHFRKGEEDEWMYKCTDEQKELFKNTFEDSVYEFCFMPAEKCRR